MTIFNTIKTSIVIPVVYFDVELLLELLDHRYLSKFISVISGVPFDIYNSFINGCLEKELFPGLSCARIYLSVNGNYTNFLNSDKNIQFM